jgi:multidrug efflux pump subunit AcrA (membrane-fusion protein)
MSFAKRLADKKALPILVIAGILALVIAKQSAEPPQQRVVKQDAVAVSLMPLTSRAIKPSVSGYGIVKAAVELHQTAEVAARVTHLNPLLVAGATIKQGAELIQLDDKDYRLALAQAKAQQKSVDAQRSELNSNKHSLLQRQTLVQEKIQLARLELKRKQDLAKVQSLSASQLDAEQQKLIGLQQEAASLQQQIEALPAQQQSLQAQLESAVAAVNQQQRNIARTRILMPFDGRIRSIDVETGEYVKQGQALFQAIGIDQVEIEAQFSLDKLRPFIQLAFANRVPRSDQSASPAQTEASQAALQANGRSLSKMLQQAGLHARISVPLAPGQFWQGDVIALRESLDPTSHTLGAVIRVNKHYDGVIPGKRPPLLAGLQVKAELLSNPADFISVPLTALHAGTDKQQLLYLAAPEANENSAYFRLKKQPVTPLLISDHQALFSKQQLQPFANKNYQLVTTDLTPAIADMRLSAAPSLKQYQEGQTGKVISTEQESNHAQ